MSEIPIGLPATHLHIHMIDTHGLVLGWTAVPLRACREIRTETGRMCGWYVKEVRMWVTHGGDLTGLLFILPDGQRVVCGCADVGLSRGLVAVGQVCTLEEIRVVHPMSRKVVVE